MTIKHFAKYWTPGSFVSEPYDYELPERSVSAALANAPSYAYGFEFYDVHVKSGVLEDGTKIDHKTVENKSGIYFIGGTKFSKDDVAEMKGTSSILYRNMVCNRWDHVVRTKQGQFFPLCPNDVILDVIL